MAGGLDISGNVARCQALEEIIKYTEAWPKYKECKVEYASTSAKMLDPDVDTDNIRDWLAMSTLFIDSLFALLPGPEAEEPNQSTQPN